MKLKKVVAMLIITATVMSTTVGNVAFAAGTDVLAERGKSDEIANEAMEETDDSAQQKEGKLADESKSVRKSVEKETKTQEAKEDEGVAVQATGTVYLDPANGSDSKDGTTVANAVKTLEKAIEQAGEGGTILTRSEVTLYTNTEVSNVTLKRDPSVNYSEPIITVMNGAILTLEDVTIDGTSTTSVDSSILLANSSQLIINGATKICNSKSKYAAIEVSSSTLIMNDGEICNNTEGRHTGGVSLVSRDEPATFIMNGGSIHDNTGGDEELSSGAIFADLWSTFTMNDGEIYNNSTEGRGGAIGNIGTVNIKGGSIHDNSAQSGGGITVCESGVLNIEGGEIASNTAQWGAGVNAYGNSTVKLSGTGAVKDNQSTANAAGIFLEGGYDGGTTFTMTGGSITGNTAGENGGAILGYPWEDAVAIEISGGTISGNTAEADGNGICLRGDTDNINEYAKLKLSGSPDIQDDVFLQNDWFPDAKVNVVGTFTPVTAVPIRDTSWTDYRTIVSYVQGVTPDIKHFTPANGYENEAIIQDGQDLQSIHTLRVQFVEEGYMADGNHKLYKTVRVLPNGTVSKDDIPEETEKGYSVVEWKNTDTGAVWDFDNDKVTASINLYPVLKLNPATYELVADKTHMHGEDGGKVTLKTEFTQHEAANITYEWKWYKDGVLLEDGKSNDTLEVTEPGEYKVIVFADDGKIRSDAVEKTITITKTDHVYGNDWKYDTTQHWKECEECQKKTDAAAHTFGDWKSEQTARAAVEVKIRTCSVCGYEERIEVPVQPEEKDISVSYTFVSGTAKKELPTEVLALLQKDSNSYAKGEIVTAIQPEKTSVKVADGVWKFTGYDADEKEAVSGVTFSGTWEFTKNSSGNNDNKDDGNKKDDNHKGDDNKGDTNINNSGNGQSGTVTTVTKTTVTNAGTVKTGDTNRTGVWTIILSISALLAAVIFGDLRKLRK